MGSPHGNGKAHIRVHSSKRGVAYLSIGSSEGSGRSRSEHQYEVDGSIRSHPASRDHVAMSHWRCVERHTLYEILNVPPDASIEEIRAAFHRLGLKVHPDQGGSNALFRRVKDAYDTLSDPKRRAEYDRSLKAGPGGGAAAGSSPPRPSGARGPGESSWPPPTTPAPSAPTRAPPGRSYVAQHPAGTVAICGILLLVLGAALARVGGGAFAALGFVVLLAGLVAMAGNRRAAMRYGAIQAGIGSVDQMTGAQFEILLESLFAGLGYRVSRVGGRGDFGADLLLEGPSGRTVVQAKRWSGTVRHDAVQEAVTAMGHYRANSAMVVTTSDFSEHARQLAQSNGVVLWDRSILSHELTRSRGLPAPGAGTRFLVALGTGMVVCFGVLLRLLLVTSGAKKRLPARRRPTRRRSTPRRR